MRDRHFILTIEGQSESDKERKRELLSIHRFTKALLLRKLYRFLDFTAVFGWFETSNARTPHLNNIIFHFTTEKTCRCLILKILNMYTGDVQNPSQKMVCRKEQFFIITYSIYLQVSTVGILTFRDFGVTILTVRLGI